MLGAIMYFLIWFPLNVMRRVWWRWEVVGREHVPPKGQGFVLASNHIHWLDIIVIGASLPLSRRPQWIAKSEVFKNPIAAWWFREMGVIPIKRGQRDLAALAAAEDALKDGALLIIFPEGHRSKDGNLQVGRGGAVRLAARSGTPIMPTAVSGTEKGLSGLMKRQPIKVCFGSVYHPNAKPDNIPADQMNTLTEEMMLEIADMLPSAYRGVYRERIASSQQPAIKQ
jgi:1-acyl-sn-glycerol-3-phosphate acyltransferase